MFLATGAALLALSRASAATRHRIATVGLATALALPALSLVLPRVPTRFLPRLGGALPAGRSTLAVVLLAAWAA
ncbi:MAG: hypothetical protein ACM3NW_02820, partial [Syntrophomonadaceae bacterium]